MMPLKKLIPTCLSLLLLFSATPSLAQLKIDVHIWGEVKNPGEYSVPDGTNILQLISKGGGPTEYADLSKVKITHATAGSNRVPRVNLSDYLDKENFELLPTLQKGDVVRVPHNAWYKWRTLIKVAADVAIIANVYYWLTRAR